MFVQSFTVADIVSDTIQQTLNGTGVVIGLIVSFPGLSALTSDP